MMIQTEKKTLYEDDREKSKSLASSPETRAYIEALEAVAEAAYNLWVQIGQPRQQEMENDVYDALEIVNFMHDDE